jgi:ABC-type uncharacterized transport system permease subunit
MGDIIGILTNILAGAVTAGIPVLFVVLGEIITERSGIINLGVEGIMLCSALASVIISYYTGDPLLGVLGAFIIGGMVGFIHAFGSITFKVNQITLGLAITILGGGLSAFIGIDYVGKKIASMNSISIPVLHQIPVIGKVFFSHNILVYIAFILIPLIGLFFSRTRWGLEVIACGDDPEAAFKTGINVRKVRYICTILGSAIAGVGGSYLALVYTQGWVENMSNGRGLIGLGLVIFSFWSPWKAFPAVLIYGGAISLQLYLQAAGVNISPFLLNMCPYAFIIIALILATYRLRSNNSTIPRSLGKPFYAGD